MLIAYGAFWDAALLGEATGNSASVVVHLMARLRTEKDYRKAGSICEALHQLTNVDIPAGISVPHDSWEDWHVERVRRWNLWKGSNDALQFFQYGQKPPYRSLVTDEEVREFEAEVGEPGK